MFRRKKEKEKLISMLKGLAMEANQTSEVAFLNSRNYTVKSERRNDLALSSAHWDGRAKAYEHLIDQLEKE